ncbi:DNA-processing protein DprA [uncultured Duncaniella sp.]|uniref:DNA-processing protein DprA n=2 Tax=uncultured Duncaniella sp. TaxID=2768039 RepID=UPI00261F9CCF|nr:DNA-processing protein DprA [uncultured Duncaniella sp.]
MMTRDMLEAEEVMALQMSGMPVAEIMKTHRTQFDRMYSDNTELKEHLEIANDTIARQEAMGIVSISCQEIRFPKRLLVIDNDCPAMIHCKGNLGLLGSEKAVAIIGARSADSAGYDKAYSLGKQYAGDGYVVVSGLALGCDSAAHRGCLDADGGTIAVVGSGLDICHPKENRPLEERILASNGLLISEWKIRVKANPTRLVARNRLQAAMSDAVILAQCPIKSGSLHTMRFARQYGKKCLAATFANQTDSNAGNYMLLDSRLAMPVN